MPAASETYQQLWQLFYRPASFEVVIEGYRRIGRLADGVELGKKEVAELKGQAFRAMQEATPDDPGRATSAILDLLVPECLDRSHDDAFEVRVIKSRYRERLRDWLESLDEKALSRIRPEVMARLIRGLYAAEPGPACYTIGVVGYRDPSVVEGLWAVVDRHDDESGDIALSTLSALGLPPSEKRRLIPIVQDRAGRRCNTGLIGAMRRLGDPAFIETVGHRWLPADDLKSWPVEKFLVFRILADIADHAADRTELQERIWDLLMAYHRAAPGEIDGDLYLGGDLAPRCDSVRVIPDLLGELLMPPDGPEGSEIRRMQLHHRLEECVRPRQLEGWIGTPRETAVPILRQDAHRDTGVRGTYKALPMDLKEFAWEALLALGDRALVSGEAFEAAAGAETSPFIRGRIAELLACFRVDPLPRTAIRWVSERADVDRADAAGELVFRPAATRLLRSAATREAFEILLHFGFTIDGAVLRQSADAVIDVAVTLARQGDLTIGAELAEVAIRGVDRRNRVVAVESLTHLLTLGLISDGSCVGLAEVLLNDASRDAYERSRIVEALGFLPREFISSELEWQIAAWAGGRDVLSSRSLETLARQDRLLAHPGLIAERLGLRSVGNRWDLESTTGDAGNTGFILGLLYEHHPESFVDAVGAFVRERDWIYAAGLLHFFGGLGGTRREVPSQVKQALIDRIRLRQSRSSAETELFGVLGEWDPAALALHPWGRYWSDWLPDARVALADALGELGPELRDPVVKHLLELMRDGCYAVRRSAYRSLGLVSHDSLFALCHASAFFEGSPGEEPPPAELRRRGAEACSWLTDDAYAALLERFFADPERAVRETADRARDERRVRADGLRYLSAVLSVTSGSADEVLAAWRYGRALSQTGDDLCIRAIRKHVGSRVLPPNVQHWLGRIEEDIEKRWKKVTQKWPEPWLQWEGSIEENKGEVVFDGGDRISVHYTLCVRPALTSSGVGDWGGAAWSSDGSTLFPMISHDAILVLADGRRGKMAIVSNSFHNIKFVCNGPFEDGSTGELATDIPTE